MQSGFNPDEQNYDGQEDKIVKIQSQFRGLKTRKEIKTGKYYATKYESKKNIWRRLQKLICCVYRVLVQRGRP